MNKRHFLFLVLLVLSFVIISLLIINPKISKSKEKKSLPLMIYVDNSASMFQYKEEINNFLNKIKTEWKGNIFIKKFAEDISGMISIDEIKANTLDFVSQYSLYDPLYQKLSFPKSKYPVLIISDFIFQDNFIPLKDKNIFYVDLKKSNKATKPKEILGTFLAKKNNYSFFENKPFFVDIDIYSSKIPQKTTLNFLMKKPYSKLLFQKEILLKEHWTRASFSVELPKKLKEVTLEATLNDKNKNKNKQVYFDTVNLLLNQNVANISLIIFKPIKEVSLIRRALEKYSFFKVKHFLLFNLSNKKTLQEILNRNSKDLFLVLGANEEQLQVIRKKKSLFINIPKINFNQESLVLLFSKGFNYQYSFLNFTGQIENSKRIWEAASKRFHYQLKDLQENDIIYHQQENQSIFFKRNNEIYLGINGFYSLNNHFIENQEDSNLEIFFVTMIRNLYNNFLKQTGTNNHRNYFLAEEITLPKEQRTLLPNLINYNKKYFVLPLIEKAGSFLQENPNVAEEIIVNYRIPAYEYFPLFSLKEKENKLLFSLKEMTKRLNDIMKTYYQEKDISYISLRNLDWPYVVLLVTFIMLLVIKRFLDNLN